MGLLDEAIREHLELKRLRGADPGAVAREEQDALGSVSREGEAGHEHEGTEDEPSLDTNGSSFSDSEPAQAIDPSAPGQETIEINMEAELAIEDDSGRKPEAMRPERAAPVAHPAHAQAPTEESLEWEVPGDGYGEPEGAPVSPVDVDSGARDDRKAADLEDVLQETPDFLSNAPEQERLWFEQRPPRDFDFNE